MVCNLRTGRQIQNANLPCIENRMAHRVVMDASVSVKCISCRRKVSKRSDGQTGTKSQLTNISKKNQIHRPINESSVGPTYLGKLRFDVASVDQVAKQHADQKRPDS